MRRLAVLLAIWLSGGVGASDAAQPCRAVRHPQLEALLPAIPKFVRGTPVGETDDDEAVARTTVDYEAGTAVISVEFMDTCGNVDMLSQFREWLMGGFTQTPGTTIRLLKVHGYPAYEEWTAESQHSEIHVLVADRFTVKVTGGGIDLPTVQKATETIEHAKLAALR